jgi:hypothetical protein
VLEQYGQNGVADGQLQIVLVDTDDLNSSNEEISEKLLEKLVNEKFELSGKKIIKTFILEPKDELSKKGKSTIKNKYELKEEQKIWANILNRLNH